MKKAKIFSPKYTRVLKGGEEQAFQKDWENYTFTYNGYSYHFSDTPKTAGLINAVMATFVRHQTPYIEYIAYHKPTKEDIPAIGKIPNQDPCLHFQPYAYCTAEVKCKDIKKIEPVHIFFCDLETRKNKKYVEHRKYILVLPFDYSNTLLIDETAHC